MPALFVERGKDKGTTLELSVPGVAVIGREASCDLRIRDVMASRRHCEVKVEADGSASLRDLGSSNGTYLDGARVRGDGWRDLAPDAKVQIGSTLISYVHHETVELEKGGELAGRTVGGYRIERRIGRGAMGTVFKARQLSLDRDVALKILAPELVRDRRRVEQFLSEARAAGRLNHPNVVQVYDVGEEGGTYFFSMEYMEGGSVEDALREGPIPVGRALEIAADALRGLEYAERQKIVHRDIKPANLMVNAEGVAKIGDLGIARRLGPDAGPGASAGSSAGASASPGPGAGSESGLDPVPEGLLDTAAETEGIAGSPLYIAPEQALGRKVDHRADLYSLGATLHHMLAGEPPFSGASPREVIVKHLHDAPAPLAQAAPDVPEGVATLVARLLEKDPAARPAGAAAVLEEVDRLGDRYPTGWEPGGTAAGEGAEGRPRRLAIGAALAVLALVAAIEVGRRVNRGADDGGGAPAAGQEEPLRGAEDPAERRAREAEAARRRLADARTALEAADTYLRDHAEDLEGARARYVEVARTYAGTEVEAPAREQADAVARTIGALEAGRREREKREADAAQAYDVLAAAVEAAKPAGLAAVLADVDAFAARWKGTKAAARVEEPKGARAGVKARIEEALGAAEREVASHLAKADVRAATGAVDALEGLALPGAAARVATLRDRVAARARDLEAARQAALAKAIEEELAAVDGADDAAARRAFRYAEVRAALEKLRPSVKTAPGRARLDERLFVVREQELLMARLQAHVNQQSKPELTLPLVGGIEGVAVSADARRLTFRARQKAIELDKSYADLAPGDLERFFDAIRPSPPERLAVAAVFLDLGDTERARRSGELARKNADRELLERIDRLLGAGEK